MLNERSNMMIPIVLFIYEKIFSYQYDVKSFITEYLIVAGGQLKMLFVMMISVRKYIGGNIY